MRNYLPTLERAWEQAEREFPKDIVRRRQRFAQLLREAQGLEPSEQDLRALLAPVLQEVKSS